MSYYCYSSLAFAIGIFLNLECDEHINNSGLLVELIVAYISWGWFPSFSKLCMELSNNKILQITFY